MSLNQPFDRDPPRFKPQLWRFENANALYYALIDELSRTLKAISRKHPNLALPTGNTMIPFYHLATQAEATLKISTWNCFHLDEYYPLKPEFAHLSFKHYLHTHFFSKLSSPPYQKNDLDGETSDPIQECERYEHLINESGGIDICLLGIGMNGHIAFNEPGSEFDSKARPVELHPSTLMTNFKGQAPITHALTLGLGTILKSKKILIVALGKNKAKSVQSAIQEYPTRTLPASVLQYHPDVTWFLDQEASELL